MKRTLYILMAAAFVAVSCEKVESETVTPTSGVVDQPRWATFIQGTGTVNEIHDADYYEELREWKEAAFDERGLATRSISYIFFADYGSMAFRFADIPDSIDVVNLWGGMPKLGSLDYEELKACQEVKGMKVVGCRITRILENAKWGMEATIPSYMRAYYGYRASHQGELDAILSQIDDFDESEYETEEEAADALKALQATYNAKDTDIENAAKNAANSALRSDISANTRMPSSWPAPDEEWPEWVVYGAGHLVNEVAEYGINGYDLDYEPEGDPLSGSNFNVFVAYMAQYMGPKADEDYKASFVHHTFTGEIVDNGDGTYSVEEEIEDEEKEIEFGDLLIIDRNSGVGDASLAKYCNFWIYQKYGSTGGASPASASDFPGNLNPDQGWVPCQVITTENVGDTYGNGCNNLEQMARFQPSTCGQKYGHKGGFASFHGQRDWRLEAEGAEPGKKIRYQHHRYGINAQAAVNYFGN